MQASNTQRRQAESLLEDVGRRLEEARADVCAVLFTLLLLCLVSNYDAQARRWQAESERATTELRAKADSITHLQEQLRASSSEKLHLQVCMRALLRVNGTIMCWHDRTVVVACHAWLSSPTQLCLPRILSIARIGRAIVLSSY